MRGAGVLDGFRGAFQLAFEDGLEQRRLVGVVLVERADADAGTFGDAGRGEPIFADGDQNLKGGFEDRVHRGGRTRLNRLFARV
jgi:hypothetical protein